MSAHGTRLFCYGTLMGGGVNRRFLANARFLGEVRTAPRYELVDLGSFPGLHEGGSVSVVGELYLVDAETLAAVDRLEGHPRLYVRLPIELSDGRSVQGYVLPRGRCPGRTIESGDWRRRGAGR